MGTGGCMGRITLVACLAVLLLGCNKQDKTQDNKTTDSISAADQKLLQEASNRLVDTFSKQLRGALMAAMQEGGAVNAISVCYDRAPIIAKTVSRDFWTIRRVSDRYRKPDNEADSHQTMILAMFQDTVQGRPADYSEWSDQDGIKVFSFYKPIFAAPMCLNCHGPQERIPPETAAAIRDKYPDDHATGYAVGELRGMFVVQAKWPEGKLVADSILADSL